MDRSIAEAPDGPLSPQPGRRSPRGRHRRAAARRWARSPSTRGRTPSTTTSTTISSGRRTRSCTERFRSTSRSRDGTRPARPNWYFQDIYPLFDADGQPTGQVLLPFPPLPALVLLPFVAVVRADRRPGGDRDRARGASASASAWWMLGGLRIRLGVRALTTVLFATGHGLVVGGRGRQHLVPRPPRRGDRRAARGGRRPARTTRAPRTSPLGRGAARPAGRGGAGRRAARPATARGRWWSASGRSTARRCSPGSCSGSPPPPACRSCSRRRSSSSSAAAGRGPGASCRRRSGGVLPVAALLLYTQLTTGSLAPPGLRLPVPARGERLPDARLPPGLVRRGPPLHPPEPRDHVRRAARRRARHQAQHARLRRPGRRCARRPGRSASLFDRGLPARHADRHRDEHPAQRARAC